MRSECAEAVANAIGRRLTAAELQDIETRLSRNKRALGRIDPEAALAMSPEERLTKAAEMAGQELMHAAEKNKQRVALTILHHDRLAKLIHEFSTNAPEPAGWLAKLRTHLPEFDALDRLLAFHGDARGGEMSTETRARAIGKDALRQMLDTMEASNPKFFGLFENNEGVRDLVREIYGEHTGNEVARKGAEQWHKIAEALRQRYNRNGGDIGHRDDWGTPHHDSQSRIAKAGRDKWADDTLPRLRRDAYANEDGTLMGDAQMKAMLGDVWLTKATDGANKGEPGKFKGNGMRANRHSESRVLHFKSADDWMAYQKDYGSTSVYQTMIHHIEGLSRDIAMLEIWGPNPDQAFAYFRDKAEQDAATASPAALGQARKRAIRSDNLYRYVAGKHQPVASEVLAKSFDNIRNWLSATRLGSAWITSWNDSATMHLTGYVNKLDAMRLFANELAAFNPANQLEKRLAMRAGLGLDTFISSMNRYGDEMLNDGFSRRIANTVLRASGLLAATEARKRAFGVTMMDAIGALTREHASLADLDKGDYRILLSKGITDTDWAVWRLAEPDDVGGNHTMLTPDAIYRIPDDKLAALGNPQQLKEDAATRLLGATLEEADVAVIEPGARERAMMSGRFQRGTWGGELARSWLLFKSFPIAMVTRHFARAWSMPTGTGKAAYLSALLAGTTVIGMASLQANEVVSGRDPRDMTDPRLWVAAMLKGGALSIYGDVLFSDSTRYGNSFMAALEGPVFGAGEDILKLTQGYAVAKMNGENTNEGANLVRFGKGLIPGSNLWWAKGALDHMVFNNMAEMFSPGFNQRMQRRAQQQYQQKHWWQPGSALPDRAPDVEAAVGGE